MSAYYPQSVTVPFNSCLRDLFNLLWAAKAFESGVNSQAFFTETPLRESLNEYLAGLDHDYAIGFAFGL